MGLMQTYFAEANASKKPTLSFTVTKKAKITDQLEGVRYMGFDFDLLKMMQEAFFDELKVCKQFCKIVEEISCKIDEWVMEKGKKNVRFIIPKSYEKRHYNDDLEDGVFMFGAIPYCITFSDKSRDKGRIEIFFIFD